MLIIIDVKMDANLQKLYEDINLTCSACLVSYEKIIF